MKENILYMKGDINMSEEIKKVESTTTEVEETVEQEESKVNRFISKVKAGAKKHKGKVLGVLTIGVVGVAAYAVGKKICNSDYDEAEAESEYEEDAIDVEYSEEDAE